MPVSPRVLLDYHEELLRSWETVNPRFEEARDQLAALYEAPRFRVFSEREAELLFYDYRRLRAWLYTLLPEIDD
jgi:hypothetical protein